MKNTEWLGLPLLMLVIYGASLASEVWGKERNNNSVECVKAGGRWVRPSGCGGADYCEGARK